VASLTTFKTSKALRFYGKRIIAAGFALANSTYLHWHKLFKLGCNAAQMLIALTLWSKQWWLMKRLNHLVSIFRAMMEINAMVFGNSLIGFLS